MVFGVLALVGAFVTVNPVWLYGPSDPGNATAGAGPIWYLAFVDGALRLIPPAGRSWPSAAPGPLPCSRRPRSPPCSCSRSRCTRSSSAGSPAIAATTSASRVPATIPRAPRSGWPASRSTSVLWAAAGADTIATQFGLSIEGVLVTLQVLAVAGPLVAGVLAWRICVELRAKSDDVLLHGFETGRIVRLPGGEYVEIHQQLPESRRALPAGDDRPAAIMLRPDQHGRISIARRAQATASRLFWRGVDE